MKRFEKQLSGLWILAACALVTAGTDDSWPGFRGPNTDARVSPGVLSTNPDPGLQIAWKVPIGSGYAGVAVVGDLVVTAFQNGERDVVAGYSAESGKELWQAPLGDAFKGLDGSHDGPISTPLIHGNRVYYLGPRGPLVALDAPTGRLVWSRDMVTDFGAKQPHYGFSTSPLMFEGNLMVMIGGEDQLLVALDPETGEKRWGVGTDTVTYQAPITWAYQGKTILVAAGQEKLWGIDPERKEAMWSREHKGSGARGVGSLVPVPVGGNRLFLALENDASAVVDLTGDAEPYRELWRERSIRNSYNVPIYHEGSIYAFSSRFLTCVDPETGISRWKSRPPGDGFMILVDGHLAIATKKGSLHLAPASPEGWQERASVQVFDSVAWSLPAYADGRFYLRGFDGLARVDLTRGETEMVDRRSTEDIMTRLEARVAAAEDKQSVIDAFMAENKQLPIIEGRDKVHFVYRGEARDVALGGDLVGARQERPLKRIAGTDLFYLTAEVAADAMLAYLFILDFKDIIADPLNPRKTETFLLGRDMEMQFGGPSQPMSWFAMPGYRAPTYLEAETTIELTDHTVPSEKIEDGVTIRVWVPEGYDQHEETYPAAYVVNGREALSVGAWDRALTAIETGPFVAIFIHMPPTRDFQTILLDEILPFVEKEYRVAADRSGRALIAMGPGTFSMGPLVAANPETFGQVAMLSCFIMGNNVATVTAALGGVPKEKLPRFYLDWGKYDFRNPQEAWDMGANSALLAEALAGVGAEVVAKPHSGGTDWTSWRTRTEPLLTTLFPKGE